MHPHPVSDPLKYAVVERERRFLVRSIPHGVISSRRIIDRDLQGTRLREVTDQDGTTTRKLRHKSRLGPRRAEIARTSLYLDDAEWEILAHRPARTLSKVRHLIARDGQHLAIDGLQDGTLVAEIQECDDLPAAVSPWLDVIGDVSADEQWTGGRLARHVKYAVAWHKPAT